VIVALIIGFVIGGYTFPKNSPKTITSTQTGTSVQTFVSFSPTTLTQLMFNSTTTFTQTVNNRYTTTEFEIVNSADISEVSQLENEIHLYDIQYLIQNQEINIPAGGVWSSNPFYSNETGYIVAGVSASTSHNTLVKLLLGR